MKNVKYVLALLVILTASTSAYPRTKIKKKDRAMAAFKKGDYTTSLALWSTYIAKYESRHKEKKCPYYTNAGIAAYHLNKIDEARNLLEHARYGLSEDAQTFAYLAKIYRKINNLSLEIDALENYVKKYPTAQHIHAIKKRLLFTYVESENWDKIQSLWKNIQTVSKDSIIYQASFLASQAGLGHIAVADSLATVILKKSPSNHTALDWRAKKYYTLAEDRYVSELADYKRHHTRAQYAILVKALNPITANYKRSLYYYNRLYHMQKTADYARNLGNIYMRLDDKPRADYYYKMVKRLK